MSHHSDPPSPRDDLSSDVTSDASDGTGPPDDSRLHREWAHLRLIEEIGSGGFGRVYRAWDSTLAREVALKLVAIPELDAEAASEVLQEGRMLARVRHPNVVTVYGALQIGQEFGLWMELVRGRSLADVVRNDGPLGPDEAAIIGLSVCRALAAVHAAGLVHRDVKAHNVMREAGGRILLMDFGAGWDASLPVTQNLGRAPGTPSYMAPEVIAGEQATQVSDIYSVGVLLYFLVTAKHPFEGRSLAELAVGHGLHHRRLLADDRPDLPEEFIRVVDRALSIDPRQRYTTAGALIQDLTRRDLRETAATIPVPRPQPQPAPPVRRSALKAFGVTAIAVIAVPWLLGMLTSAAFNVTLGRPSGFADESVFSWWRWGVLVLVPPLIYMSAAALVFFLARSAWRLARRLVPPLDRWCSSIMIRMRELVGQSALEELGVRGQVLVLVEAIVIAAIAWRFWGLILAQSALINEAAPDVTRPLGPDNILERAAYGWAVDGLVLIGGACWVALVRTRRARGLPAYDGSVVAGIAALALAMLLMWALPYRVSWYNEFQRVQYRDQRCYAIGQRPDELLLYCPELTPPRNRVVPQDDPGLRRHDVVESIFTPARLAPDGI